MTKKWLISRQARQAIKKNKKNGLLCACNQERVPYYSPDGQEEGGTKTVDGIIHGYDDCVPEPRRA